MTEPQPYCRECGRPIDEPTPATDTATREDYARLATDGIPDRRLYLNDAVYHAVAYRLLNDERQLRATRAREEVEEDRALVRGALSWLTGRIGPDLVHEAMDASRAEIARANAVHVATPTDRAV